MDIYIKCKYNSIKFELKYIIDLYSCKERIYDKCKIIKFVMLIRKSIYPISTKIFIYTYGYCKKQSIPICNCKDI